jgi:hypothetical protein
MKPARFFLIVFASKAAGLLTSFIEQDRGTITPLSQAVAYSGEDMIQVEGEPGRLLI